MDRLIWTAWRAFWVGLGASAVLISQSLLAPASPGASSTPAGELAPPAMMAPANTSTVKSTDPVVSKSSLGALRAKTSARIHNAS